MAFLDYTPTKDLVHYTSPSGFLGIVDSKRLWLCDLKKSNDPREGLFGRNIYEQILRENVFQEFIKSTRGAVEKFNELLYTQIETQEMYSCCFSYEPDNINMWREYSIDGTGISISFRRRAITDMVGRFHKVIYVSDSTTEEVAQIVIESLKILDQVGEVILDDFTETIQLISACLAIISSLKHDSWSAENEMRLTYASSSSPQSREFPRSILPDGQEIFWSPPLSREVKDGQSHYYAHEFGAFRDGSYDPSFAISKITIGPKCKMTEKEVEGILSRNGFKGYEITKSKCCYL